MKEMREREKGEKEEIDSKQDVTHLKSQFIPFNTQGLVICLLESSFCILFFFELDKSITGEGVSLVN